VERELHWRGAMKRLLMPTFVLMLAASPALADHEDTSGNEFGGCVGDTSSSEDHSGNEIGGCVGDTSSFAGGNATTMGLIALVGFAVSRRRVA
jgi:hypothetical protein